MEEKMIEKSTNEQYIDNFMLSNSIINLYDYDKTRENVNCMIDNYLKLQYKYINIQTPKITTNYEVRYECYVPKKTDPVGRYIERKFDAYNEVEEFYGEMTDVFARMNKDEKVFFTENLLNKKSEEYVAEKLGISRKGLKPIKYSCVIKLAIAFGIEEYVDSYE